MKCPSCGAAVEDGADLCLECGEPMGESPAAKVARDENVIRPPADAFVPPKPAPPPTLPGKPVAKKKWAVEEPEPVRCPGCGVKSHAARCPNCGNKLKHDED
jgi:predicted amidophosphoribosyltransferase